MKVSDTEQHKTLSGYMRNETFKFVEERNRCIWQSWEIVKKHVSCPFVHRGLKISIEHQNVNHLNLIQTQTKLRKITWAGDGVIIPLEIAISACGVWGRVDYIDLSILVDWYLFH